MFEILKYQEINYVFKHYHLEFYYVNLKFKKKCTTVYNIVSWF